MSRPRKLLIIFIGILSASLCDGAHILLRDGDVGMEEGVPELKGSLNASKDAPENSTNLVLEKTENKNEGQAQDSEELEKEYKDDLNGHWGRPIQGKRSWKPYPKPKPVPHHDPWDMNQDESGYYDDNYYSWLWGGSGGNSRGGRNGKSWGGRSSFRVRG